MTPAPGAAHPSEAVGGTADLKGALAALDAAKAEAGAGLAALDRRVRPPLLGIGGMGAAVLVAGLAGAGVAAWRLGVETPERVAMWGGIAAGAGAVLMIGVMLAARGRVAPAARGLAQALAEAEGAVRHALLQNDAERERRG